MESTAVQNSANCAVIEAPAVHTAQLPLSFVKVGEAVRVIKVRGKGELHHHLENLGFVDGAQVKVVTQNNGNLIVEVKGAQIALDKDVALRVITSS